LQRGKGRDGCLKNDVLVPINCIDFINQEVPLHTRAKLVPIIKESYLLVNDSIKNSPFLNWEIGLRHSGYLRPIAIQFLIKRAVDQGQVNIRTRIGTNSKKTSKHLELVTDNAVITISQVMSSKKIARPAFFRKYYQNADQLLFNFENKDEKVSDQPIHLLLTHGYGGLTPRFINLGIPNKNGSWIDRINLMNEPHVITTPESDRIKEEVITEEKLVSFKKFVQGVQESGT
jgi:hypothetical protein